VSINIFWLQRLWPVLRNSGPLISRLADAYVKRGADQKSAEAMAEMAVLLDQILDERLKSVAQVGDVRALQQDLAALRSEVAKIHPAPRRNPYVLLLLLGEVVIGVLLILILVHL
jgi:capsular polysaccharide biosynthesis protein